VDEIVVRLHVVDWIIVGLYIAGMLWIGFYFSKKSKGFDDYFMAGKKITAPLLVATLVSTFYGLDSLFGDSEVAFFEGVSSFFFYALPYTALYLVMAILSPKFKEKFPEDCTMQDIVFNKYGKTAGIFSSIAAFIYSTNTIEMMGIGFLLHLITGIPFWAGTLIGAVIIFIYTWTGGLWAVVMTDFIQFFIMMVAVGLALILGWNGLGGYDQVIVGLENYVGEFEYFFQAEAGYLTPWILFAYSLTAFAVLAEPAFFQRIFASAGPKEIKKAFAVGIPMWLIFDWIVVFLGILGAAAIGLEIIPEVEPNQALFAVAGQYLPVGIVGLFLAGVLACSMSTADSYFLVSGGVIGYDLYKGVIKPQATSQETERATKIGVLISAVVSLALALFFDRMMEAWVFQATIIITTSLVPVYFGTFSKKPPKKIAGTLATALGLIASIGWYIWTNFFGTWDDFYEVYVVQIGNVQLWQEYGIIIITPIVLVVFLVANALGKEIAVQRGVKG